MTGVLADGSAPDPPTDVPHVQLRTSNRSENVAVVRELLEGVAGALGLERELTDDIKTAVSEACNNVVLHAYEGGAGPMEMDITARAHELEFVVRDHGTGIRPHADWAEGSLHGVGLAVIQSYADRVQLRGHHGEGTEVRMSFTLPERVPEAAFPPHGAVTAPRPTGPEVVMAVCGGELLGAVLARVTAAMAVRAHFTVDRLCDAQLVADTVAAQAATAALREQIVVALQSASRELVLRVGPLAPGGGRELAQAAPGGLAPVLERLCDEVGVELESVSEHAEGGEHVRVRITDPR